jgi:hypothetical protein
MRVVGSVADWEQWAGMALPESGSYVVPGALVPLKVDRDRDVGEDLEPACWVRHRVPRSQTPTRASPAASGGYRNARHAAPVD